MSFGDAIKSGFNNYVNFNGRASRSEYNYWVLFIILLSIFALTLDPIDLYTGEGGMLSNILSLALILPGVAVMIRRFHDINKSGWNYFWSLTIIGVFPVLYWLVFKAGDNGSNSYGVDPLSNSLPLQSDQSEDISSSTDAPELSDEPSQESSDEPESIDENASEKPEWEDILRDCKKRMTYVGEYLRV